jgi:hypothetical protein
MTTSNLPTQFIGQPNSSATSADWKKFLAEMRQLPQDPSTRGAISLAESMIVAGRGGGTLPAPLPPKQGVGFRVNGVPPSRDITPLLIRTYC